MSSDCFVVKVVSVDGPVVVLDSRPTTAGGYADMAYTRSYVLLLSTDVGGDPGGPAHSSEWAAANVDRLVESAEVLSVTGLTFEPAIRQYAERYRLPISALQPVVRIRAKFRDEKLARAFTPGTTFGTTAWDVWWDDPMRPAKLPAAQEPVVDYGLGPQAASELCTRLIPSALPAQWAPMPGNPGCFVRDVGPVRWMLKARPMGIVVPYVPPELSYVGLEATVPAAETNRKPTRKDPGPMVFVHGSLMDGAPGAEEWFRRAPEGGAREPLEAVAARIAARLASAEPAIVANSTLEALRTRVETECALQASGYAKVKTFAWLGPRAEPPADAPSLKLYAAGGPSPGALFWKRAVLLRAMGDEAGAREAVRQANGRWKKIPTEFASRLAGLG